MTPRRGRPAGTTVRYREVAGEIRRRIEQGEWRAGEILPSIRELARRLGQSKGVVGQAVEELKAQNLLAGGIRRRLTIKGTAHEGRVASGVILEVVSSSFRLALPSPLFLELQLGIEHGAGDLLAPLLIAHSSHWQDAVPADLEQLSLRGIALVGTFTEEVLRYYEGLNVPAVLVDHPGGAWKMHAVGVDNQAAAADAARRLLALGHRRIAFLRRVSLLRREVEIDSRERQDGLAQALKDAGLRLKASALFNLTPKDNAASSVYRAVLQAKPAFTAAIAVDPGVAAGLIRAAHAQGWNVPRDLSVVSFLGSRSHASSWDLSGPRYDFQALSRHAIGLLNKPKSKPVHDRFKAVWHQGKTIAGPLPRSQHLPDRRKG